jgi:hypothetical protein
MVPSRLGAEDTKLRLQRDVEADWR